MAIDKSAADKLQAAFAYEDQSLAVWGGTDALRLELLMDYWSRGGIVHPASPGCQRCAGPLWTNPLTMRPYIRSKSFSPYPSMQKALTSGAVELFEPLAKALRACLGERDPLQSQSLAFEPLYLKGPGSSQNIIWPWKTASWADVEARRQLAFVQLDGRSSENMMKTHTATLMRGPAAQYAPAGTWLRYRPEQELNRVLMPAAALIAISSVWEQMAEGRDLLLWLLVYTNQYFQAPDRIPLASDAMAVAAALEAVMAHGSRTSDDFREANRTVAEFRRRDDAIRHQHGQKAQATATQVPMGSVNWDPVEERLAHWFESAFKWLRRR